MMNLLEEKRRNRWLMLRKFYEITGGRSDAYIVDMWDVGEQLGWKRETTETTYDYLEGEGLLKAMTLGGGATITHQGVREVEDAESNPNEPTLHFPRFIINFNNETTYGDKFEGITNATLINRSSVESAFNQTTIPVDEEIAKTLSAITEAIENSQNVAARLLWENFMAELKSQKPSKSKLRQCWEGVLAVLPSISTIASAGAQIAPLFA